MTNVLIVDDKPENIYLLRVLLQGHGFAVTEARHGAEALVLARKMPPHLVVSDLLMPVMDGYTLLRNWKADERLKTIPFVVYTATYTEPKDERLALDLGADAFILKPTEPEALMARLKEMLRRMEQSPVEPRQPKDDTMGVLKDYGEVLIRKLEQKALALEQANRALQEDLVLRQRAEAEAVRLRQEAELAHRALLETTEEQRKAEGALRHEQSLFHILASTIPDHIYFKDRQSRFVRINHAMMRAFGLAAPAEAVGKTDFDFFAEAFAGHAFAEEQRIMETGEALINLEEESSTRDGRRTWISTTKMPFRDAEGRVIGLVGISRDITPRKETERRLREQAELLDKANEAIVVADLANHIRFWSHGAERLFGWTATEVIGKPIRDVFVRRDGTDSRFLPDLANLGDWRGEVHVHHRGGALLVIETSITVLRDESGQASGRLSISTDITEKKKLEEQFLRAQRLESIGMLATGIAHDLNNVLSPISMSASLLRTQLSERGDLDLLSTLEKCASRGSGLVQQILAFTQGIGGEPRLLQVKHLLHDIRHLIEETFPKSIVFQNQIADGLWTVMGNPTQIHQVLLNLCVNARDAMPRGGTLVLGAENVVLDAQAASAIEGARPGAWLVLFVEDSGTGIPPDVLRHIWEPFFTTKGAGKGTGLGLATVRGIVETHHGFTTVRTELGQGTAFRIHLPAAESPVAGQGETRISPNMPGRGELILLVEDEESIRLAAAAILTRAGFRVVTASNGADAVVLFEARPAEFALVITDTDMPVLDGADLSRIIHSMRPELKILVVSGLTSQNPRTKPVPFASHFMAKPFTGEMLLTTVDKLLHPQRRG